MADEQAHERDRVGAVRPPVSRPLPERESMMYEPFIRPMQMGGPGYSYSPEPSDPSGGMSGLMRPRNTGVVPPHMRTGGGAPMSNASIPMHTGGGYPAFQIPGYGMQTGGPGQMQQPQFPMQPGGGMQMFPQQGLFAQAQRFGRWSG